METIISNNNNFNYIDLNEKYYNIWNEQPNSFVYLSKISYTNSSNYINELKSKILLYKYYINSTFKKIYFKEAFINKGINNFIEFEKIYNFEIFKLFKYDILKISRAFVYDFKKTEFNFEYIRIYEQAIRSLAIMNIIQIYKGNNPSYSKSMFAYNMLYLITDNYLDNNKISLENKIAFSSKFKNKIIGEKIIADNEHEKSIIDFLEIIEKEHPRNIKKELYSIFLRLQNSQEYSFLLSKKEISFSEILKITLEKGGLAVIANGMLSIGNFDKSSRELFYGLGSVLQLIDDFIDIEEDIKSNNYTIFTYYIKNNVSLIMLFEGVANNQKYFSKDFLKEYEKYSSFSYSYIKNYHHLFKKNFNILFLINFCLSNSKLPQHYINSK
jgi:hypothetical protein